VREEGRVNRDVHDDQASCGSVTGASRFLTGSAWRAGNALACASLARARPGQGKPEKLKG
jgi:hypothetical protein